jgi:hypothetical protein
MDNSAWLSLWGSEVAKAEFELKERERFHERTQGRETAAPSTR